MFEMTLGDLASLVGLRYPLPGSRSAAGRPETAGRRAGSCW